MVGLNTETAAHLTAQHPDFGILAARICVSNMHKNTSKNFVETTTRLYNYINPRTGKPGPLISDRVMNVVKEHGERINAAIVYNR